MRLVFDIETNPIDFSKGNAVDQVTDVWCIVAYDLDLDHYYVFHPGLEFDEWPDWQTAAIKCLEEADELIGHNIIEFDLPILEAKLGLRRPGKITDTLVLSRLLYPDRPGGHSLRAWGERLNEPKLESPEFHEFSQEMLEYCRGDVRVNARVYQQLRSGLSDGDWERALKLETRIADIIARQERHGFKFNEQKARGLVNEWTDRMAAIDERALSTAQYGITCGRTVNKPFLISGALSQLGRKAAAESGIDHDCIGGPWCNLVYGKPDLGSVKQQREFLLKLGWKPTDLTPTGLPKINESILQLGEIGELVHERNILSHRLSSVQGYLDVMDQDGRVHAGANPCGTNTHRMTHRRVANLPRVTSPLGSEIRSLFTVPDGKELVGYDAASLELRILAHYIGNEEYNEKVTTTNKAEDAHTLAARIAGSDDRDLGKTINYALIFGAGDYRLGQIIGGSKSDGRRLRDRLYNEIPGFGELVDRVQKASRRGFLVGLDGRRLYVRQGKSALNTLIQGGGAVFMKNVTSALDDLAVDISGAHKVVDMHDEAQWECPSASVPSLESAIHEAFRHAAEVLGLRCPQEAEVKVGKSWAETH